MQQIETSEKAKLRKERSQNILKKKLLKNTEANKNAKKDAGGGTKIQNKILKNPKFAMLARMKGNQVKSNIPEEKQNEEVKIEVDNDAPDEIIMNRPSLTNNTGKKKTC